MKDSGLPWIGQIPDHWTMERGKNILSLLDRPTLPNDGVITCFRDGEVTLRSNRREDGFTFSDLEIGYQGIEPGDLVIHGMDGFAGSIGISDSRGKATPVLNVLDSTQDKKYLMYFLRCMAYNGVFLALSTGIRVRSCDTNWNKIKNVTFTLPPLNEQHKIAVKIDDSCSKADHLIESYSNAINEYKILKCSIVTQAVTKGIKHTKQMKYSGYDWLGDVPIDWDIIYSRYILSVLNRPVKEDDSVITCFRDGVVTLRANRREEGFTVSIKEDGYQGIEPNDLVIHGMDGFAGAIGISDSRGKGTPVLNVFDSSQYKPYLKYYYRALAWVGYFMAHSSGIRIRTCDTNWNKIKGTPCLIPPIYEQKEIATYLDDKCSAIDSIILSMQKAINEIEDYKKSIIFEYVTGKKEVE